MSALRPVLLLEDNLRVIFSEPFTKVPVRKVSEDPVPVSSTLLQRKDGVKWNHTFPFSFLNSTLVLRALTNCLPLFSVDEFRLPSS